MKKAKREILIKFKFNWEDYDDVCDELIMEDGVQLKDGVSYDIINKENIGELSDGYHTFNELYKHRHNLFIALCKLLSQNKKYQIWRSKKHFDGTMYEGWFIMGINTEKGKQISYHLPIFMWAICQFAETLLKAPEFDGHSSNDVLKRLKQLT